MTDKKENSTIVYPAPNLEQSKVVYRQFTDKEKEEIKGKVDSMVKALMKKLNDDYYKWLGG